ncbi:hypothetical protein DID88_007453 [Monilinia fructigena]|uniref:Uncharacterized protein n=1 Tax=Monilinia fructigena TaxID=38457 RepID=A0A395JDE5_9HELO|nr:hypothetical protein DID88_007453 [Monilinia fructigena]
MEPNMQGGSMSTFTAVDPDSTKKPKRGGARPRKSKEQKQAEKDSAAAAQEAIDKGESPALMPVRDAAEFKDTKPLPSKEGVKEESPSAPVDQHNTKMFHVVYDQIWKDLARKKFPRQKRKLNFLISQTELLLPFHCKKIKTDEVERSTDHPDVAVPDNTDPCKPDHGDLPEGSAPAKVTNFEDLDFDAEDESVLKAAAMANAQNAIQEAQNKARAFNKQDDAPAMDDEGENEFPKPCRYG